MKSEELREDAGRFIHAVENLDSGECALLRRNAGNTLQNSRGGALGAFYKILPATVSPWQEETWFLAATLCSLARTRMAVNQKQSLDFGWTMRQARKTDSQDTRFRALLDCQVDQEGLSLAHRLRQMVKLADGRGVPIDWTQFLMDLLFWDHPDKFIQKRWARSYYSKGPIEELHQKEDKGEEQC